MKKQNATLAEINATGRYQVEQLPSHGRWGKNYECLCIRNIETGKTRNLSPRHAQYIYLTGGQASIDISDAEALVSSGAALRVCPRAIYMEYYGIPEAEMATIVRGYDARTDAYLSTISARIGFDHAEWNEDPSHTTALADIDICHWAIGTTPDGQWVAQKFMREACRELFFSRRPSLSDIATADMIATIRDTFEAGGRISDTYTCWECGREAHWLDVPGTLSEKFDAARDHYCGC